MDWELHELRLWLGHGPLFFLGREAEKQQRNSRHRLRWAGPNPGWKMAPFPMGILAHA